MSSKRKRTSKAAKATALRQPINRTPLPKYVVGLPPEYVMANAYSLELMADHVEDAECMWPSQDRSPLPAYPSQLTDDLLCRMR